MLTAHCTPSVLTKGLPDAKRFVAKSPAACFPMQLTSLTVSGCCTHAYKEGLDVTGLAQASCPLLDRHIVQSRCLTMVRA